MREIDVQQITDVVEKYVLKQTSFFRKMYSGRSKPVAAVKTGRLPRGFWTILLPILRLPKKNRFQSVRILVWHAYSLRLVRMFI